MSIWDIRQAIESAIPAWVEIPVILFAVVLTIYAIKTRGIRK